jgi:hypothetical protein
MLSAERSALEVLAHGATHIRLESGDESQVECWNYRHRRATIAAFGRVGVHFTRKVVGELLLGMRWRRHLHLWALYRDDRACREAHTRWRTVPARIRGADATRVPWRFEWAGGTDPALPAPV